MTDADAQDALRDAVRGLLGRASEADAWRRLCDEVGVAGLVVPERYAGAGAGLPEACVVLEELGRTLTPYPMLGSAVITATAVLACGDAGERLLPAIATGEVTAALVWTGADGGWDPAAPACRWDGELHGQAHYVLDGAGADVLVVAARTPDGVGLFEASPADAKVTAATAMDPTRPLGTVTLDGCPARPLGTGDRTAALAHVRDVACAALAAEQAGTAARALELTVAYTKERVQFGRPIGAFQALAHRMADLHVLVETARSAAWAAACAPEPELPLLAAVAKTHCSEALTRVAAEMIQLHGGIGITWEHDAHRYFKRAHGGAQLFGQPHEHVTRLAATVLAPPEGSSA
ncbi:MAG: acyl-CoA dehydrogenase family protein [Pseudonocardia sp.]|nr:acyl-CoA dehydrogenase family protein [Pseudonocardia sp.]